MGQDIVLRCIILATLSLATGCVNSPGNRQNNQCTTAYSSAAERNPPATTLKLAAIVPAPGTTLEMDTVLSADLDYAVRDFQSGQFVIMAQFDTNGNGRTGGGNDGDNPMVKSAVGTLHLCFPMT